MSVFEKLKSLITKLDSNKHKNLCGGLLSIVTVIVLIYFGLTNFVQMINRENTENSSTDQEVDPLELNIPDL